MKRNDVLMLTLIVLSAASMNAQVNIGSGDAPTPGTVLDLSQSATPLGLRLPIVSLSGDNTLQLAGGNRDSVGIVVYNDGKGALPAGLYVWSGGKWLVVETNGGTNNGNYDTQLIGDTWWTTENLSFGTSETDYYAKDFNNGRDTITRDLFNPLDSVVYKKGNNRGYYYTRSQAIIACESLGAGWHLPTIDEWDALQLAYADMSDRLKAKWRDGPMSRAGWFNVGSLGVAYWEYWGYNSSWWQAPDASGLLRRRECRWNDYNVISNWKSIGIPGVDDAKWALSVRCTKSLE